LLNRFGDIQKVVLRLMQGSVEKDVICAYPELKYEALTLELPFFRRQYRFSSLDEMRLIMKGLSKEVRVMFSEVEKLLRLLLISPSSSCTAERSFSSLRRLKSWLRNSMKQERLNSLMVCHTHKDILESVSIESIAQEFIDCSPDRRRDVFGKY